MEVRDISQSGRYRFIKWSEKQRKNHNHVNIAFLITNSPSEFKLFKMCRFIDKCWEARQALAASQMSEVSTPDTSPENASESVCEGLAPKAEAAPESDIDYREKHRALKSPTQKKYDGYSSHTKGRILDISKGRIDVPISQIIMDADTEDDVIRAIEGIKEVPVNPEIRFWICREVI